MIQQKFEVKLLAVPNSQAAALKLPFDVFEVFGQRGRVPAERPETREKQISAMMDSHRNHRRKR